MNSSCRNCRSPIKIEAKEAELAFHRLGFGVSSSDTDIRLVWDYLRQQVLRESRENTPLSYMNREQEVVANLNKKLGQN